MSLLEFFQPHSSCDWRECVFQLSFSSYRTAFEERQQQYRSYKNLHFLCWIGFLLGGCGGGGGVGWKKKRLESWMYSSFCVFQHQSNRVLSWTVTCSSQLIALQLHTVGPTSVFSTQSLHYYYYCCFGPFRMKIKIPLFFFPPPLYDDDDSVSIWPKFRSRQMMNKTTATTVYFEWRLWNDWANSVFPGFMSVTKFFFTGAHAGFSILCVMPIPLKTIPEEELELRDLC